MNELKESLLNKSLYFSILLFLGFSAWLLFMIFTGMGPDSHGAQIWASSYQILAWFGALCGLYFSSLWGGTKSVVGKANLAFTLGLLGQSIGQSIFSYFYFQGIEVPYPSIADIGYFGSIPFYIYGMYLLTQLTGAQFSFRAKSTKLIGLGLLVLILGASYFVFLREYQVDWSQPLTVLLDFGYPFGQALYVAIAVIAFIFSKNYLGGIMRMPILYFIIALVVQYLADYLFLYQVSRGTYVGGLEVDFLYLLAYFAMSFSLIKLGSTFYKITNS